MSADPGLLFPEKLRRYHGPLRNTDVDEHCIRAPDGDVYSASEIEVVTVKEAPSELGAIRDPR